MLLFSRAGAKRTREDDEAAAVKWANPFFSPGSGEKKQAVEAAPKLAVTTKRENDFKRVYTQDQLLCFRDACTECPLVLVGRYNNPEPELVTMPNAKNSAELAAVPAHLKEQPSAHALDPSVLAGAAE